MRTSIVFLRCLVVLLAIAGTLPNTALAQVLASGYTFYGGDEAFPDDAALVSGSAEFTCTWGNALPASSFAEALDGVHLGRCVNHVTPDGGVVDPDGGVVEVLFLDNLVMNGVGADLVILELSAGKGRGYVESTQNFGVSVPVEGGFSEFLYFDPVSTGIYSCTYGTPCAGTFAAEVDLSDFGVPEGGLIDSLQLHLYDVGLGAGSADIAVIGALHSAPLGAVCEEPEPLPQSEPLPDPEALRRGFAVDVRSVQIPPPSERRMIVCRDDKSKKSRWGRRGKKCSMKKVFDEGGVDYTISVADHGLVEIDSATLVISVYDLDLIPHVRDYGRRGTKWTSFSETMRISAGDHEIVYLDDGFAVDHGVTETNNVAATYEITLGDEALKALAEAGDELHIELEASYVDYKGRARMMMMNSPEQIAMLFLAEGH